MIVDIHTHNTIKSEFVAIRNLDFTQAEEHFSANQKEFISVGFHPWYADDFSIESFEKLKKWAFEKEFVAIGECGLDKNSKIPFEQQLFVYEQQIALSENVGKPLIIHCVGCFNELFKLKKKWNPAQLWIIHGFRGKPELAKQALKAGCGLSFGEHYNVESVKLTPLDKLFAETDESKVPIQDIYNQLSLIKLCEVADLNAGYLLFESFLKQNTV